MSHKGVVWVKEHISEKISQVITLWLMQTQAHTHTTAYNPNPISSPDYNGSKCVYKVSESVMMTT